MESFQCVDGAVFGRLLGELDAFFVTSPVEPGSAADSVYHFEFLPGFWFWVENALVGQEIDHAFGALDFERVAFVLVGAGGTEVSDHAFLVVADGHLHVVKGLPAVLVEVDPARAEQGAGTGLKGPVDEVHLVRQQLGHESSGVVLVHSPVDLSLQRCFRDGTSPVPVAIPAGIDGGDFAQEAFLDVFFDFEVQRRVAVLVSDLDDLLGIVLGDFDQVQGLIHLEGHGFFQEKMLTCFQSGFAVLVVQVEGSGNHDDVQAWVIEQLAVVFVKSDCLARAGLAGIFQSEIQLIADAAHLKLVLKLSQGVINPRAPVSKADDSYLELFVGRLGDTPQACTSQYCRC